MILYGRGGHSRAVQMVLARNGITVTGFIDTNDENYPYKPEYEGMPVIVAIGDNQIRERLTIWCKTVGKMSPVNAVDPSATVLGRINGYGSVVMAGAVIQVDAEIGSGVIINTCSSIDHHCVVDDYAHICPGVHLAGGVRVGKGTMLGTGTVVCPRVKVAAGLSIPAGTVITRDVLTDEDMAKIRARRTQEAHP